MSENLRNYRNLSPSEKLHAFLLHDNLKHFLCLIALQFILREEEHTDSVFPLLS